VGVRRDAATGRRGAAAGGPVRRITDRTLLLEDLPLMAGTALVPACDRCSVTPPEDPDAQREAARLVEEVLSALLPVDEEGQLVNAIVEQVENDSDVSRYGRSSSGSG
jgi:hypothetical protein